MSYSGVRSGPGTAEIARAYIEGLEPDELQLIRLCEGIYDGVWREMVMDLKARRDRKPEIPKLNRRIDVDLGRIKDMRTFEAKHHICLVEAYRQMEKQTG